MTERADSDLVSNYIHSYAYDELNRLTGVDHFDASGEYESTIWPDETFAYDDTGNRTRYNGAAGYAYTAANRIQADGELGYAHDANGNMTEKKLGYTVRDRYYYDAENRLTGAENAAGGRFDYAYDFNGRRIGKRLDADGPGGPAPAERVKYVYDGEDVIAEFRWDAAAGKDVLRAMWLHGPGVDEPLAAWMDYDSAAPGGDVRLDELTYYFDGLGSVTALVDESGAVGARYHYSAYGKTIACGPLAEMNPYRYTGREYDAETGLYYYRERVYDYNIGVFLQEDPVLSTNLYTYALSNPINLIDPFGRDTRIYYHSSANAGVPHLWIYTDPDMGFKTGGSFSVLELKVFSDELQQVGEYIHEDIDVFSINIDWISSQGESNISGFIRSATEDWDHQSLYDGVNIICVTFVNDALKAGFDCPECKFTPRPWKFMEGFLKSGKIKSITYYTDKFPSIKKAAWLRSLAEKYKVKILIRAIYTSHNKDILL